MRKKTTWAVGCAAVAAGALTFGTASPVHAGRDAREETIRGAAGAEVRVQRGSGGGCAGTSMDIISGAVEDPTPGLVSTVVVAVDSSCKVRISQQRQRQRVARDAGPAESLDTTGKVEVMGSDAGGSSTDFEANAIYGNYVRSSQTLQDVFNVDIAKWKWTHDRVWDTVTTKTRFKVPGTCSSSPTGCWWGQSSTSVTWNHPRSANFATADTAWKTGTASSIGFGEFHSDFLWCNHQPGQNFRLTTEVKSWNPGGYDAKFTQSRTCSGTHMATSKWTATEHAPY